MSTEPQIPRLDTSFLHPPDEDASSCNAQNKPKQTTLWEGHLVTASVAQIRSDIKRHLNFTPTAQPELGCSRRFGSGRISNRNVKELVGGSKIRHQSSPTVSGSDSRHSMTRNMLIKICHLVKCGPIYVNRS